jgi:large repetitive protein
MSKRWLVVALLLTACGDDSARHILDAPSSGSDAAKAIDAPAVAAPDFIWFVLDETSGTTAKDSSSHHYDITGLTGVTWANGAQLDGTGGGGSVAVDSSYRLPPLTLSAWLKPAARADETSIVGPLQPYPSNAIGDDIPAEFGYGLGLNTWTDGTPGAALTVEGVNACVPGASFPVACDLAATSGATVFTSGIEYLVTVTIDTSLVAHAYVNGAPYADATAGALQANATQFWLGRHNDDTSYGTKRFFDGGIRDVRVYKKVLAPSEVASLYAAGPTTVAP